MNPAGIVLIIAGLWVSTQVFGGDALKRLNIVKDTPDPDAPKIEAPGPMGPNNPHGGMGGI